MDWGDRLTKLWIQRFKKPADFAWGTGLIAELFARLGELLLSGDPLFGWTWLHPFLWGAIIAGTAVSFGPSLISWWRHRDDLVRVGNIQGRTVLEGGHRDFMDTSAWWVAVSLPLTFRRSTGRAAIRVRTQQPKCQAIEHETIELGHRLKGGTFDLPLLYINVRNSNPSAWVVSKKASLNSMADVTFTIDVFDKRGKMQPVVQVLRFIKQKSEANGHPADNSLINIDPWIVPL